MTILTLTCDLLTLKVCHVQCLSCLTHIPICIILRLSFNESRVLNIWSHFRYLRQSLRMRRVTWPLIGGKNSQHFKNPWPRFVTFTALRRRLSHVIGKNSVFLLWRLHSLLCMRSITLPVHRRSPKTTRNNFWPRIVYSLYNFYAATMTIKVSLYLSSPILKQFSVAKSPVKIGPRNGGFSEI